MKTATMVSGQISLCFSEAFDSPIKSELKAWLGLAWIWVLVCGLCIGWSTTNQEKVWDVTFEEMKEVLLGEGSELSLALSNFCMDTLEDTANKMCIGLADGGKHWGETQEMNYWQSFSYSGKVTSSRKNLHAWRGCDHQWGEHLICAGSRMWQWKIGPLWGSRREDGAESTTEITAFQTILLVIIVFLECCFTQGTSARNQHPRENSGWKKEKKKIKK